MTRKNPGQHLAGGLRLIVISDVEMAGGEEAMVRALEDALDAGARAVQLRDKTRSARALLPLARHLADRCRDRGALFFVNDRVDLALASGAHGVHVGPHDLPVAAVRRCVPDHFIVGASTDDPQEAVRLVSDGADYIGCGAIWATGSKADAGTPVGPEGAGNVVRAVGGRSGVPIVAIGGITPERVAALAGTGIAGVAVIGSIMGSPDPGGATRSMLSALETLTGS